MPMCGCTLMRAAQQSRRPTCPPLSLTPPPSPGLADAAAALLAIADDNGLPHLRAVALDYIVHHHAEVARTGAGGCGL